MEIALPGHFMPGVREGRHSSEGGRRRLPKGLRPRKKEEEVARP